MNETQSLAEHLRRFSPIGTMVANVLQNAGMVKIHSRTPISSSEWWKEPMVRVAVVDIERLKVSLFDGSYMRYRNAGAKGAKLLWDFFDLDNYVPAPPFDGAEPQATQNALKVTKQQQFLQIVQTGILARAIADPGDHTAPNARADDAMVFMEEAIDISTRIPADVTPLEAARTYFNWRWGRPFDRKDDWLWPDGESHIEATDP